VFGLARGGVPIAYEVARALRARLGVFVVRKLGAPGQPEFGVGAVTAGGVPIYDRRSLAALGLSTADMRATCERERAEALRQAELYHGDAPPIAVAGRDVIVADDGLATGVTARAALRDLRAAGPDTLVFAAPVCAPDAAHALLAEADRVECLTCPPDFHAVGQFYQDFRQTSDEQVLALLERSRA